MEKLIKRPLKLIAAAAFMVALGYGVSTNSEVSELSSFINLSALSGVSAQGETEDPCSESKWDVYDNGNGTIVCTSGGSCKCPC